MTPFGPFSQVVSGPATLFLNHSPQSYDIARREFGRDGYNDGFSTPEEPTSDLLDDMRLVQAVKKILLYEKQRKIPVQDTADITNQLYNNFYAKDADKMGWQSKARYPGMFIAVEKLARSMVKLLDASPDWLQIDSTIKKNQIWYNLNKAFVLFNLKKANWRMFLTQAFRDMLLNSTAHAMVTYKVQNIPMMDSNKLSDTDEDSKFENLMMGLFRERPNDIDSPSPFIPNTSIPKLGLDLIDPAWFYKDSSGRDRYVAWYSEISVGELLYKAEEWGYDRDACLRAMGQEFLDIYNSETRNAFTRGVRPAPEDETYGHVKVRLLHFEGTLYDLETGEQIFENKYCVIANEKEIVKQPVDIPFWDGESAVVSAPLINIARSVYGKTLIGENNDSFTVMHNLMNLLCDFFQLTMMNGYQLDTDLLDPEDQLQRNAAIYPGMIVRTIGNTSGKPVLQPVLNTDLPTGFWNFFQFFKTEHVENSGTSPETGGNTRTRGRITASEFQARSSEAGSLIESVFNDIEDTFIQPIIQAVFLRALQYYPNEVWRGWVLSSIDRIIPDSQNMTPEVKQEWTEKLTEAANWSASERFRKLGNYFSFSITIFSSLMDRQMDIEKATYFLNVISKVPGAFNVVKLPVLLRKITEAFGWDPEEMLYGEPPPGDGSSPAHQASAGDLVSPDLSRGAFGNLRMAAGNATGSPLANSGAPPNPAPNPANPPADPGMGGARPNG